MAAEKKYKIVYHHNCLGDGAEGIHIREMIAALRADGHHIIVNAPAAGKGSKEAVNSGRFKRLAKLKTLTPVWLMRLMQALHSLINYRHVSNILKKERPAFLFERCSLFNFGGALAAKRLGVPYILEVNTPYSYEYADYIKIPFFESI